jgi:hypothetical protein
MRQGYTGISLFFCEEGRVQFISDGMKLDFVILGVPLEKLLFFMTPLEQQLVWH